MRVAAVAVLAAALLVACGDGDGEAVRSDEPPADRPQPPDRDPDIAGPVSAVRSPGDGRDGAVRIDEGSGAFDAAQAAVDGDTDVLRRTAGGYERTGLGDLHAGERAEVWFEGPVAESYPVQARAGAVVFGP